MVEVSPLQSQEFMNNLACGQWENFWQSTNAMMRLLPLMIARILIFLGTVHRQHHQLHITDPAWESIPTFTMMAQTMCRTPCLVSMIKNSSLPTAHSRLLQSVQITSRST